MTYVSYVMWFTIKQAVLSTFLTIPLGVLIARAIVWNHTWGPARLCLKLLGLPLITPALVGILGFIVLFGDIFNVFSLSGIITAHVVFSSPFVALFMINAWRLIPEEHYKLAAQLQLSSFYIFYYVELPQLRKALFEVSWICFCLFLNSFTTVMVLGGGPQKTTLCVALYQSLFFLYNPEQGFHFAELQLLLTLSLAAATFIFKALPGGYSLKVQTFPNLVSSSQKPFIWLGFGLILFPLFVVIVPSLSALSQALHNPLLWQSFIKSLTLSLLLGPLSAFLTFIFVRHEMFFGKPLASLYLLVPPAFIGALLFYLSLNMPKVSSDVYLTIVQLFIILPFSFRVLQGPYMALKSTYGPTVASLGLSSFQRLRLIEWPLLKKPLATILGLGFALSFGDFQSLAFFAHPEIPGLSSLLYQQMTLHFDESMGTALILLTLCYFLYQLPHWILKTYDRTYTS